MNSVGGKSCNTLRKDSCKIISVQNMAWHAVNSRPKCWLSKLFIHWKSETPNADAKSLFQDHLKPVPEIELANGPAIQFSSLYRGNKTAQQVTPPEHIGYDGTTSPERQNVAPSATGSKLIKWNNACALIWVPAFYNKQNEDRLHYGKKQPFFFQSWK